jgi:hypothetical protein
MRIGEGIEAAKPECITGVVHFAETEKVFIKKIQD